MQINKAFIGFLTHTGFAHGGNGYEAIAFLIERFRDKGLKEPGERGHGIDLLAVANEYAKQYSKYKAEQKAIGNIDYAKVPCVNHPVFKGKPVNYDPRERFVSSLFEEKGIYNVFLDFYGKLVTSLFENKVTANVYCVNVDAVIAVILLKMLWKPFVKKGITEEEIERGGVHDIPLRKDDRLRRRDRRPHKQGPQHGYEDCGEQMLLRDVRRCKGC